MIFGLRRRGAPPQAARLTRASCGLAHADVKLGNAKTEIPPEGQEDSDERLTRDEALQQLVVPRTLRKITD